LADYEVRVERASKLEYTGFTGRSSIIESRKDPVTIEKSYAVADVFNRDGSFAGWKTLLRVDGLVSASMKIGGFDNLCGTAAGGECGLRAAIDHTSTKPQFRYVDNLAGQPEALEIWLPKDTLPQVLGTELDLAAEPLPSLFAAIAPVVTNIISDTEEGMLLRGKHLGAVQSVRLSGCKDCDHGLSPGNTLLALTTPTNARPGPYPIQFVLPGNVVVEALNAAGDPLYLTVRKPKEQPADPSAPKPPAARGGTIKPAAEKPVPESWRDSKQYKTP
jgi:hypothetical protein